VPRQPGRGRLPEGRQVQPVIVRLFPRFYVAMGKVGNRPDLMSRSDAIPAEQPQLLRHGTMLTPFRFPSPTPASISGQRVTPGQMGCGGIRSPSWEAPSLQPTSTDWNADPLWSPVSRLRIVFARDMDEVISELGFEYAIAPALSIWSRVSRLTASS